MKAVSESVRSEQFRPDNQFANDLFLHELADRRLRQITMALCLPARHFEHAHEAAKQSLGNAMDQILSDQGRRVAEALPEISDTLVRARIVGLVAALADDDKPDPTA